MSHRRRLAMAIVLSLIAISYGRELMVKHEHVDHYLRVYNHTLAKILVEYASAVYVSNLTQLFSWTCSRCHDMTRGFEVVELMIDVEHCLQGFVGVAKNLNAVVIAFRGTEEFSIQNWVEDLFLKRLDLNYPGTPDAMVHHGFYSAYHNTTLVRGVVNGVKRVRDYYGDLDIMVTGHSLGGAIAAFCGLDLTLNHDAKNVVVMTFGQPRVGNAAFASYYSQLVPNTIRVTNANDIVPHLPPYDHHFPQKTYHHFPEEVWLYKIGQGSLVYTVEKICDSTGEDLTCSRSVSGTSILDHLHYYGVELEATTRRPCGIVMDPYVKKYSRTDDNGNVVLSRDLTSPSLD